MTKGLKTAPELERYILIELRTCAGCNSVSAVTVSEIQNQPETNWDVTHINVPGGVVPRVCRDICTAAVERLRERYDLVTEIEPDEL
jgi:hypothetical protein